MSIVFEEMPIAFKEILIATAVMNSRFLGAINKFLMMVSRFLGAIDNFLAMVARHVMIIPPLKVLDSKL